VYGLFGYTWLWRKHAQDVFMPDAFWNFALVWLVVGFTPLTEWVGIGRMANAAHLGGLLAGLFWGWLTLGRHASASGNEKSPE
jgi:GlpG protein